MDSYLTPLMNRLLIIGFIEAMLNQLYIDYSDRAIKLNSLLQETSISHFLIIIINILPPDFYSSIISQFNLKQKQNSKLIES